MSHLRDERAQERALMVERQIRMRGGADPRVLEAMQKVPRHLFVPKNKAGYAYEDCALSIGSGQTISQPYIVALMSELLHLEGMERVLEVGTGSGYQAAILCELAGMLYSIERLPNLALAAEKALTDAGYSNFEIKVGDGSLGWPEHAPYDAILVTAAGPETPQALLDQLADGGRLVIPVGLQHLQTLQVWHRSGDNFEKEEAGRVVFVPLIGAQGWQEDRETPWS